MKSKTNPSSHFFDSRSIGLFRIILGIGLIFQHILIKWPAWELFFSENGCLYQRKYLEFIGELHPSIFLQIQSIGLFHLVMTLALLSYICILLGLKTKYTSFIAIFFFWNINQHLVFLSSGWDMYGMCMLTMALLLPLDQAFSVSPSKYKLRNIRENQKWIYRFCLLQISLIYITSSLTKTDITWLNGSAFQNIISDQHLQRWFAPMLLKSPPLLKGLNYLTLILEFSIGIFVLLYAFLPKRVKALPSFLIFLLHFGIFLVIDVEPFIFYALGAAALLIPNNSWPEKSNLNNDHNLYDKINLFRLAPKFIALCLIALCLIANLHSLGNRSFVKGILQKTKVKKITSKLMSLRFEQSSFINQTWDFYSRTVPEIGCISIIAEFNNGERVDVLKMANLDLCEQNNYFSKKQLSLLRIYALSESSNVILDHYAQCLTEQHLSANELERLEKISITMINK